MATIAAMPHGYNPFVRIGPDTWACRECGFWNAYDQTRCDDCGADEDGNLPEDDMAEALDDGIDIPDFLKVANRVPLTPEQAQRVAEITKAAGGRRRHRDFWQPKSMPDDEWRRLKRERERAAEKAKQERLAALRAARTH